MSGTEQLNVLTEKMLAIKNALIARCDVLARMPTDARQRYIIDAEKTKLQEELKAAIKEVNDYLRTFTDGKIIKVEMNF